MSEFEDIFKQATTSLVSEKKIKIDGDVYVYSGTTKPQSEPTPKPKDPKKPKKKEKKPEPDMPDMEPIPADFTLTPEMIDIIVENANLINLGRFLGYNETDITDIIYNKTTYTSKKLPPSTGARVDALNNIQINMDVFNHILKNYNNPSKPVKYWYGIYAISHEIVHVMTGSVYPEEIAESLAEAFVPIIQYEFYANYNGAPNPHLIDLAETGAERMAQKKKGLLRPAYPPLTYYFFDQLLGFNFIDHRKFVQTLNDYTHAPRPSKDKLLAIRKTFPIEVE